MATLIYKPDRFNRTNRTTFTANAHFEQFYDELIQQLFKIQKKLLEKQKIMLELTKDDVKVDTRITDENQ